MLSQTRESIETVPNELLVQSVKEVLQELELFHIDKVRFLEGKIVFTGNFLVAMVGFSGRVAGLLSIFCSQQLALKVTGQFWGTPVDAVNAQVRDALGELANIIAGRLKKLLEEIVPEAIHLSIPTVIEGTNFSTNRFNTGQNRLLCVQGKEGVFYVQLSVKA